MTNMNLISCFVSRGYIEKFVIEQLNTAKTLDGLEIMNSSVNRLLILTIVHRGCTSIGDKLISTRFLPKETNSIKTGGFRRGRSKYSLCDLYLKECTILNHPMQKVLLR